MQYRHLGRAGVRVSSIALGSWLTYGSSVGEESAVQCIHKAYDIGINFFDTANVYFPMGEGPNDRGLSRKHIMEQCHASLRRLGTDYIDLYQCHRYDPETPLEETLRALDDLVTQGKILYAGVSEWSAVQIDDAVSIARQFNLDKITSNQPLYNMLERNIEQDIIPLCEREGIGQVVFSPLAQGILTGKYKPGQQPEQGTRASNESINMFMKRMLSDDVLSAVQKLKDLAEQSGHTLAQMALAWVLRQKNVTSVITGASRPQQVEENVKASEITLSEDLLHHIDEILGDVIQ